MTKEVLERTNANIMAKIYSGRYHPIDPKNFQPIQLDKPPDNALYRALHRFNKDLTFSSQSFSQKNTSNVCTSLMFTWLQNIRSFVSTPDILLWVTSATDTKWTKSQSESPFSREIKKKWGLNLEGNLTRFKRSDGNPDKTETNSTNRMNSDSNEKKPKIQTTTIPQWAVYTIECVSSFVGTLLFFKIATKIYKQIRPNQDKEENDEPCNEFLTVTMKGLN